ncbi:MAG: hypothetical protein J7L15_02095 [Clostridiales bacterium]|nr:hypothetical protein [Clostridiales bacterium]
MWESLRGNVFGQRNIEDFVELKDAKTHKEITDKLMSEAETDFNGMFGGPLQGLPKVGTGNISKVDWGKLTTHFSDQKNKISIDGINEVLKEKGYPEFNEILEYFLDAHPEYKL